MSTELTKSPDPRIHLLQALSLILILVAGSMITSEAAANDGTVCIQRATADECKRKVLAFDQLAGEASVVRRQRDEAVGAREELRYLYTLEREQLLDWQKRAETAQAALDASPSRLVWFGVGAGSAVVTTVIVFVLVR